MPNCDFYACGDDFELVLGFVFDQLDCRVFEAYSSFEKELREFHSPSDLIERTGKGNSSNRLRSDSLVLWPVEASDEVRIRRIDLDPDRCKNLGAYRYTIEGWGLINLRLGEVGSDGIHPSHTNHNSAKRAEVWADAAGKRLGPPNAWKWEIVTRMSAKLNRHIRSHGTAKLGSQTILPVAKTLIDSGTAALPI